MGVGIFKTHAGPTGKTLLLIATKGFSDEFSFHVPSFCPTSASRLEPVAGNTNEAIFSVALLLVKEQLMAQPSAGHTQARGFRPNDVIWQLPEEVS